jgi:hypothetical protein
VQSAGDRRGQLRPLRDRSRRRSRRTTAPIGVLPKLIVRVRFSSPALLQRPRSETVSLAWALLVIFGGWLASCLSAAEFGLGQLAERVSHGVLTVRPAVLIDQCCSRSQGGFAALRRGPASAPALPWRPADARRANIRSGSQDLYAYEEARRRGPGRRRQNSLHVSARQLSFSANSSSGRSPAACNSANCSGCCGIGTCQLA